MKRYFTQADQNWFQSNLKSGDFLCPTPDCESRNLYDLDRSTSRDRILEQYECHDCGRTFTIEYRFDRIS